MHEQHLLKQLKKKQADTCICKVYHNFDQWYTIYIYTTPSIILLTPHNNSPKALLDAYHWSIVQLTRWITSEFQSFLFTSIMHARTGPSHHSPYRCHQHNHWSTIQIKAQTKHLRKFPLCQMHDQPPHRCFSTKSPKLDSSSNDLTHHTRSPSAFGPSFRKM